VSRSQRLRAVMMTLISVACHFTIFEFELC
jgi:hypothetical protein